MNHFRSINLENFLLRFLQLSLSFSIDLRLYTPDFTVIDETEDYLVVDKPPHLMVHPSVPGNPPTLLDGIQALCAYEIACGKQISLVNRLDRETSGITLVAKHREAARMLGKAMERREFQKGYFAVVRGWPEEEEFTVDAPILRKGEIAASPVWVQQAVHPAGKASLTHFRVLARFKKRTSNGELFSLLSCSPKTGRMHQIRVHAAHAGYPLVGDKIYGISEHSYLEFIEQGWTSALEQTLLLNRQALHAAFLSWEFHRWHSPLPADLASFCGESVANLSSANPDSLF